MNPTPRTALRATIFVAALLWVGNASALEPSVFAGLLPDGFVLEDAPRAGFGAAVGTIEAVDGPVALVRAEAQSGFRAIVDARLFQGDTVVTGRGGHAQLRLRDASVLTVTPVSRLVVNRTVYETARKTRLSFLTVPIGKVRFLVKKLAGARQSEFQVRTRTAVAGVRGSDFAIEANETGTEVTTFEHTRLEVGGLAAPQHDPVVLSDFERTRVQPGGVPTPPEKVSPGEIERLKQEFTVLAQRGGPSGADREAAGGGTREGEDAGDPSPAQGDETPRFPQRELIPPAPGDVRSVFDAGALREILPRAAPPRETRDEAATQKIEEIRRELPPLPGRPRP